MWPSTPSRCWRAAFEPGAGTGVSSARIWASHVLPRAGVTVQPGPGVQDVCIRAHHPLPRHMAPHLPRNGAFPQPCPPPGIHPHAMGRKGGDGDEGKFLPCFQGDGKSQNGGKAAFPPGACRLPAATQRAFLQPRSPRHMRAKLWLTTMQQLRGQPRTPLSVPGTRSILRPAVLQHPRPPSTITCTGIVSVRRGQKPPPSRAA